MVMWAFDWGHTDWAQGCCALTGFRDSGSLLLRWLSLFLFDARSWGDADLFFDDRTWLSFRDDFRGCGLTNIDLNLYLFLKFNELLHPIIIFFCLSDPLEHIPINFLILPLFHDDT